MCPFYCCKSSVLLVQIMHHCYSISCSDIKVVYIVILILNLGYSCLIGYT